MNPFTKAENQSKRAKVLCYGQAGVWKTRFCLAWPGLAIIDTEGGTDHYGEDYYRLRTTDPVVILDTVRWLAANKHEYKTLAIDSYTDYWDALQKRWSDIRLTEKGRRGMENEYHDLQFRDWGPLKSELRQLERYLKQLDMNVICTCRVKTNYNKHMVEVGYGAAHEKNTEHVFDAVLEFFTEEDKGEKVLMRVHKDRTGKIGKTGTVKELRPKDVISAFGKQAPAVPYPYATDSQVEAIEGAFDKLIQAGKNTMYDLRKRLRDFGSEEIRELSQENAELALEGLQKALDKLPRTDLEPFPDEVTDPKKGA